MVAALPESQTEFIKIDSFLAQFISRRNGINQTAWSRALQRKNFISCKTLIINDKNIKVPCRENRTNLLDTQVGERLAPVRKADWNHMPEYVNDSGGSHTLMLAQADAPSFKRY